jgi:hypothetical protein
MACLNYTEYDGRDEDISAGEASGGTSTIDGPYGSTQSCVHNLGALVRLINGALIFVYTQ